MALRHRNVNVRDVQEHLYAVLRDAEEEHEIVDVTDRGVVIARLVPTGARPVTTGHDPVEWDQLADELSFDGLEGVSVVDLVSDGRRSLPLSQEEILEVWQEATALAAEIGRYITEEVDAVELVRDIRRDL